MAVSLSPIGGAGAQFFDNNGVPLAGGKLYSYEAGTTTPKVTYTSYAGTTPNSNPIVLNAAGRIPYEVWLTTGESYKFVLTDSIGNQIGTWDNIYGYSSGSVDAVTEVQTATAGQTLFVLNTMAYNPGSNTLGVFVDGVNQVVNNAYLETNATSVTFVSGLHAGAVVKFVNINVASTDSSVSTYAPGFAGSVATTVQAKLQETVSVKDFGAVGDGVTDDTAAIQTAIDYACPSQLAPYAASEIKALWFPSGVYKVSNLLLQKKGATNDDNRFFVIYGNGVRIEQISGSTGPALEISSCKKLHISDFQIYGETYITGVWDSIFENINFNAYGGDGNYGVKFGTRYAAGSDLFESNYWNKFSRCRLGKTEFKIYGTSNQEFNANTFDSCISEAIEIVGNANGSFQGNVWTGGELRGNPFISIDAARNTPTPNSLTVISAYFDQSGNQSDLFDFHIKTLGVCPTVNGYVLDGQPLAKAGSNQEIGLAGVRTGQRVPVSAANLVINGDHNASAIGETTVDGVALYNSIASVASTGGTGPFSRYATYTTTGSFPYARYQTTPLPLDSTYTMTVIYKKPSSNSMAVRFNTSAASSDVYDAFANANTYFLGQWVVASYTFSAVAGTVAYALFYESVSGKSIDVAYVGCTMGSTGLILAAGAQSTIAQPQVLWRTAAPTNGTWAQGSIVWNKSPTAGGSAGWICTSAGTPGTWKTFGAIAT